MKTASQIATFIVFLSVCTRVLGTDRAHADAAVRTIASQNVRQELSEALEVLDSEQKISTLEWRKAVVRLIASNNEDVAMYAIKRDPMEWLNIVGSKRAQNSYDIKLTALSMLELASPGAGLGGEQQFADEAIVLKLSDILLSALVSNGLTSSQMKLSSATRGATAKWLIQLSNESAKSTSLDSMVAAAMKTIGQLAQGMPDDSTIYQR